LKTIGTLINIKERERKSLIFGAITQGGLLSKAHHVKCRDNLLRNIFC